MTHLAIQEAPGGKAVEWLEKVTDEQYSADAAISTPPVAQLRITQPNVAGRRLSPQDVQTVAPALEKYTQERLYGDVWKRPGLTARDRSLVTIAAMLARGEAPALTYYFDQALENGVTPREISETITHLAFYTGWGNSFAAVGPAKEVFARRGIGPDQLPPATVTLLPLHEAAEAQRAAGVAQQFGAVAPGVVQYTTEVLFRDLWRRPDLAPRDRSLITVSALVATGQVAQMRYHLNRAMDNGLTQEQAGEAMTHLAFYTGWPNVFSALPVAKEVFESRAKPPATVQTGAAISPPVAQKNGMVVRISEIQIDPKHLDEYNAILREEAEASMRLEPGVISIFPMYQQQDPTQVRILEIYSSVEAYKAHINTPHFQKYKTTTLHMVRSLKLIDMESIDPATMTRAFAKIR
jgi:4-carboxymuconolactone decarboxylase